MNLNATRRLRRLCLRFFNCRMADATGVEPVHPRLTTSSWRIEGRPCASCDSFLVYQLGEPDPGVDGHPFADAGSAGFEVAQTPTAYFRERLLLLALKGLGRFAATGSGLLCGFCQLSLLVLVRSTVPGRLKGFPVVGVSVGHGVFTPSPPKYRL